MDNRPYWTIKDLPEPQQLVLATQANNPPSDRDLLQAYLIDRLTKMLKELDADLRLDLVPEMAALAAQEETPRMKAEMIVMGSEDLNQLIPSGLRADQWIQIPKGTDLYQEAEDLDLRGVLTAIETSLTA
jgi:hypothetical protein